MSLEGATLNLFIVIILSAIIGYLWPTAITTKGNGNMDRVYQSAYSALLGALITIFITILLLYGLKIDDGVSQPVY
jgi:uncharacterized membrane protein required for colicin V production